MSKTTKARNVRKTNYTSVGNNVLNDPAVTLQAKGLLSIFLSNSIDWEINMKEIISRSKNGRDAQYKVVKELIEHGYFARITIKTLSGKFDDMEYIFSDNKDDVAEEIIEMKKWAEDNEKKLEIEYLVKKAKKPLPENQDTEEKPFTENQDTAEKPFPENQDTENRDTENADTENKYINNTNEKNTNLNNTNINNPNLNLHREDILWDMEIPHELKNKVKVMMNDNEISLSHSQILEIGEAYKHQIKRGFVEPKCAFDDIEALNDEDFMNTVVKMLRTVKDIRTMRGLIQEWVEIALSYKKDQFHVIDFSGVKPKGDIPFYDWLNA